MGYRDDFYIAENIAGYTGKIRDNPTVYFATESEHGRITQDHDNKTNIGREWLKSTEGYSMANENYEGKYRLVEREGGKVKHFSRHDFVNMEGMSQDNKALLYQAIWKWTELKKKYQK